jgi:2-polyprenyl-6-methoxyphenol hydroxylase-like FAD-dependent oxidoreductase
MGDAAHTTHFTIGSGTKLAVEDAIALAERLDGYADLPTALEAYGTQRRADLALPKRDAAHSAQWFEHVPRYVGLPAPQFATLLRQRRSRLLPHLPPPLYYRLYRATGQIGVWRRLWELASS